MKQKEVSADVNGNHVKITYQVLKGPEGISYKGIAGKLHFIISHQEDKLVFTPTLDDVVQRKAIIAAIFDNEEQV